MGIQMSKTCLKTGIEVAQKIKLKAKNKKADLPYDPAITFLDMYPKEMKLAWWKTCLHCYIH